MFRAYPVVIKSGSVVCSLATTIKSHDESPLNAARCKFWLDIEPVARYECYPLALLGEH